MEENRASFSIISPQVNLEDSVCGADIPPAMLEFNNDVAVMEGCDKVE